MYHTIEFNVDLSLDLEVSRKHPLERVLIRKGTRVEAQMKPSVVETRDGPIEVASLFLADGTTARSVPYNSFRFVD